MKETGGSRGDYHVGSQEVLSLIPTERKKRGKHYEAIKKHITRFILQTKRNRYQGEAYRR